VSPQLAQLVLEIIKLGFTAVVLVILTDQPKHPNRRAPPWRGLSVVRRRSAHRGARVGLYTAA
jgi:hypothetical protein